MMLLGGPVFWVLVVLALVALLTYFERLMDLRRSQVDYEDFLKGVINVLEARNDDEALSICDDIAVPVSKVVAAAIRNSNGSEKALKKAVDSQSRIELGRLDRRLAALAIVGQVSPLIGLLGTIIGFIKTMLLANTQAIVSRVDLFQGAMEALVSAALGLMVAISVMVMYGSLRVRLERIIVDVDAASTMIINFLISRKEATR